MRVPEGLGVLTPYSFADDAEGYVADAAMVRRSPGAVCALKQYLADVPAPD